MLLLASSSPRRHELLSRLDIPFRVMPSGVDERPARPREAPAAYALELAAEKARAVARNFPSDIVLAADTVVAVDGTLLGKPVDEADAFRMLNLLRGKRHKVVTGVIVRRGPLERGDTVTASVLMKRFSDEEAWQYVAGGEPMDKAGAYAIQGGGGILVAGVHGCYNTVIGLPLCLTADLLRACGLDLPAAHIVRCDHRNLE